tara:strand:- start:1 stop:156 length:156 start_codon:yes stop_codon:yes gene_type:complete
MKLTDEGAWEYATAFSAFIDHFLEKGASPDNVKEMLSKMVDAVQYERELLV